MILNCRWLPLLFAALLASNNAFSEDDLAARLAAAEMQQRIADLQRQTAEAELAAFRTRFVVDTSGMPKGEIKASNLTIEPTMLAYGAVNDVAAQIASEVIAQHPRNVFFLDSSMSSAIAAARAYEEQLEIVESSCKAALERPAPPSTRSEARAETQTFVGPAAVVSAAVGLIGLFKTDQNLTGATVNVEQASIEAAVAAAMMSCSTPPSVITSRALFPDTGNSSILKTIESLRQKRDEIRPTEKWADQQLAGLEARGDRSYADELRLFKANLVSIEPVVKNALEPFDSLSSSSTAAIQSLLIASMLASRLAAEGSYVLTLTPSVAGGTTKTTMNILTSGLWYSGGVVVGYTLTRPDGQIVKSGVVSAYRGPWKLRKVKDAMTPDSARDRRRDGS